jgi:hypothetical protein
VHPRGRQKKEKSPTRVTAEFILRGTNSRADHLLLRWTASESLYYGGKLTIVSGPVGIRSRFERRLAKTDWLRNDPTRATGGKHFTESYFATVAVLMAFAEVEKLVFESVRSPLPLAGANRIVSTDAYTELTDFDRPGIQDSDTMAPRISGRLGA